MRRALAAVGPAAPELAWERYADPALWSTWSPQVRSVDADGPRLVAGLTGTVHGWGGLRLPFTVHSVDDLEAPGGAGGLRRRWSWSVHPQRVVLELPSPLARRGQVHLEHEVLTSPGGGVLTTLVLTGAAPVVAAYAPLALAALRRLVR